MKTVQQHERKIRLDTEDRAETRRQVVDTWLAELPGHHQLSHRYRYWAETLEDGSHIYLTRPARLNKGMDFVINCEGFLRYKNGKDRPPAFSTLLEELNEFCGLSDACSREMKRALMRIWNCEQPDKVVTDLNLFSANLAAERCLKLARWFFIEQDLTYWTDSGRHMLRKSLEERFGALAEL